MLEQIGMSLMTVVGTVLAVIFSLSAMLKRSIRDAVQMENRLTRIEARLDGIEEQTEICRTCTLKKAARATSARKRRTLE